MSSSRLFAQALSGFSISPLFWVNADENASLMIPLSESEIDIAVFSSKSNSALGPHSFSTTFFKRLWPDLKHLVYAIIQGTLDTSKLNYAALSLIPKVKELIRSVSSS